MSASCRQGKWLKLHSRSPMTTFSPRVGWAELGSDQPRRRRDGGDQRDVELSAPISVVTVDRAASASRSPRLKSKPIGRPVVDQLVVGVREPAAGETDRCGVEVGTIAVAGNSPRTGSIPSGQGTGDASEITSTYPRARHARHCSRAVRAAQNCHAGPLLNFMPQHRQGSSGLLSGTPPRWRVLRFGVPDLEVETVDSPTSAVPAGRSAVPDGRTGRGARGAANSLFGKDDRRSAESEHRMARLDPRRSTSHEGMSCPSAAHGHPRGPYRLRSDLVSQRASSVVHTIAQADARWRPRVGPGASRGVFGGVVRLRGRRSRREPSSRRRRARTRGADHVRRDRLRA